MSKKNYIKLENAVIEIFNREGSFIINDTRYNVLLVGKPRPSSGECKTDVLIIGENELSNRIQLKISVKTKKSNEFQENKVSAEKAEAYFGADWKEIIIAATKSIANEFENRPLIYVSGKHPVKPNSITLGWKLEIANKPRSLSVKAPLTEKQIKDYVYKGTNQSLEKKNAYVNGHYIENSGVADFLLITEIDEINSTKDIIDKLVLIDNADLPETYLIFTANNYRTEEDKADGPRPLAVYVDWKCIGNKLNHKIIYDYPLQYLGEKDIKPILQKALSQLGKQHPNQLDPAIDLRNPSILIP